MFVADVSASIPDDPSSRKGTMNYLLHCSILLVCATLAACAAAPQTQAPAATALPAARMAAHSPTVPATQPSEPAPTTVQQARLRDINGPSPATPTSAPTPTTTGTASPTPVYARDPECNVIHMTDARNGWLLLYVSPRYPTADMRPLYLINAFPLRHLETHDGGKTWQTVSTDIISLRQFGAYYKCSSDASWVGEQHIWTTVDPLPKCYNDHPDVLIMTHDGGNTWQTAELTSIVSMFFLSPDEGWVATEQKLFHTVDGGSTWEDLHSNKKHAYLWKFTDSQRGYATFSEPDGGKGYKTTDGGRTWTLGNEDINGVCKYAIEADAETHTVPVVSFVICGSGRPVEYAPIELFKSSDGKATWQKIVTSPPEYLGLAGNVDSYGFKEMYFLDEQHGWLVVELKDSANDSRLRRTTDGGVTWQTVAETKNVWVDLYFDSPEHGYAVFQDRRVGIIEQVIEPFEPFIKRFVVETHDGGATWENVRRYP